jgi:Ca2+-transporting ATPase
MSMEDIELKPIPQPGTTFFLSPESLGNWLDPKNPKELHELGGISVLAKKLYTNLERGLSTIPNGATAIDMNISKTSLNEKPLLTDADPLAARKAFYGVNVLPPPVSKTIFQFIWEALHDKMLIVLMVAAVIEMAIGIYKVVARRDFAAIIDGIAIVLAGKSYMMTFMG